MSIAVSVIVGPSRIHRALLCGCALAQAGAALAVGLFAPARFPGGPWLALVLAGTAAVLGRAAARPPKTHRIDISGTGELRLTVQQDVALDGGGGAMSAAAAATPALLLPGSVAWPALAVLRVAVPGASVWALPQVIPVWRDSVDPHAWRGLMVALGVIGRRAGGAVGA